jgi:hypothetical protein
MIPENQIKLYMELFAQEELQNCCIKLKENGLLVQTPVDRLSIFMSEHGSLTIHRESDGKTFLAGLYPQFKALDRVRKDFRKVVARNLDFVDWRK